MQPVQQNNTVIVLLSGLIGLIIGIFIGVQFSSKDVPEIKNNLGDKMQEVTNSSADTKSAGTDSDGKVDSTLVSGNSSDVAFSIPISGLPQAQQTALKAMGINGDSFVVTKGMVACAEAKIGAQRVKEIQNGASTSVSEGLTLMGCYKAN